MFDIFLVTLAQAAESSDTGSGSSMSLFIFFGAMFLIMYLLVIRPQRKEEKRKRAMISAVKKGDAVVTQGGIHGVVTAVHQEKRVATIKIGEGTKVDFNLSAISVVKE
jgi:preprotein translocase subunit YajC